MNGLIWAGLGEGISKAGTTFGTYMGKAIEEDWKEERDAKRQEAAERRQQALEIVKQQMKERETAANAAKEAADATAVETNTEAVLKSKGFQKFVSDLGPTEATPEQLAKIYLNTYHDRTVTAEPGGDRYDVRESERASERVNQARKVGASSGMVKSYVDELKEANKKDKENDDKKFREKVEARKENEGQERIRQRDEQIAATLARIGSTGSGGGKTPAEIKAMSSLDIERSIGASERKIALALGVEAKDLPNTLARLTKSSSPEARAKLDSISPLVDEYRSLLDRQIDLNRNKPKGEPDASADAKPTSTKVEAPKATNSPPISALQEGKNTTFGNGQVWTLVGGKPKRVR